MYYRSNINVRARTRHTEHMTRKLLSLSRQLAKVEREQADRARRKKLANCICGDPTIAVSTAPERFEAEMNRTCPVHGFRRSDTYLLLSLNARTGQSRRTGLKRWTGR